MFKFKIVHKGKLYRFSDKSKDVVYSQAVDFLSKNNINFNPDDVANQISDKPKSAYRSKSVSLADAFNGAKALVRYTQGNSASDKEILRRASICSDCPHSSKVSGCAACGASRKVANFANKVRSLKGSQIPIPPSVSDKYCGICDCSLSLMVVTKYSDFYEENEEKNNKRPDRCWLKRTSPNFTKE